MSVVALPSCNRKSRDGSISDFLYSLLSSPRRDLEWRKGKEQDKGHGCGFKRGSAHGTRLLEGSRSSWIGGGGGGMNC